jgi:protein-L-isoaspartate(D-aspartate) O-methyltransferase
MSDYYATARRKLVADLEKKGLVRTASIKAAFLKVPRDKFVSSALAAQSYLDDALPIGDGQTISKPSIVAQMIEALQPAGEKVLEIGTGSGYATALLATLAQEVYTIERHRSLGLRARRLLQSLHYTNIQFLTGDGGDGWLAKSPFTRILVTAEADHVPKELVEQLSLGGRMLLPMKGRLCAILRTIDGFETEDLGPARFVPFVIGVPPLARR